MEKDGWTIVLKNEKMRLLHIVIQLFFVNVNKNPIILVFTKEMKIVIIVNAVSPVCVFKSTFCHSPAFLSSLLKTYDSEVFL